MARKNVKKLKSPADYLHLTFRPTPNQFRLVDSLAKARGVSRGAIVKEALTAHLKGVAA